MISMPPAYPSIKQQESRATPWYHNPWFVFLVALTLRSSAVFAFHLERYMVAVRLPTYGGPFEFGAEMGRIAASLVSGHGYGNPFYGFTGPSAWVPPLYPFIIAAIFRLLGTYTIPAAQALILINATFGALIIFPIQFIARRCFGPKVAIASIWVWAVWPFTMIYTPRIWATSVNALLFTCVLALCLVMRDIGRKPGSTPQPANTRQWLILGLLWALIALADPTLLLMAPVSFIWILLPRWSEPGRPHLRSQILRAALSFGLFLCCITPWTIRNAVVFHRLIPIRSELGAELYLGNGPGSNGQLKEYDEPFNSPHQYSLYRSMGEIAYCKMRGAAAKAFIRRHPAHFLADTIRRVYYYWFGLPRPSTPSPIIEYAVNANLILTSICGFFGLTLAFRNRLPATGLFSWAIALCPLTYYFIVIEPRFRYPLDPLLYILTLYLWTSAEEGYRVRILSPSWWRARRASHS
jgi:hypothetical protein